MEKALSNVRVNIVSKDKVSLGALPRHSSYHSVQSILGAKQMSVIQLSSVSKKIKESDGVAPGTIVRDSCLLHDSCSTQPNTSTQNMPFMPVS